MANLSNINNKFLVTTTGEVLIGQTSNNGNRLQITGADGASYIYLKTDVATTGGRIGFNSDDLRVFNQQASGELQLGTAGVSRVRISNSLVVFPTITELRGDIATKFAIGNMGGASSQMMVSSRGFLTFNVSNTGSALDATERMRIDSSGNVGIGTTVPASELQVGGTDVSGTANFDAQFAVLSEATTGYPSGFMFLAPRVATSSNRVLLNQDFGTYFSTQVYATSNASVQSDTPIVFAPLGGNVGIGVTDPKNRLNIFSGTDTMMGFWGSSTYSAMQSVNLANTVLKDMRFDFDKAFFIGNAVGIGTTTPGSRLEVVTSGTNTVLELDNSDTNYTLIQYNANGSTKGFSGFNSAFMVFGGESGTTTRFQSGGSYAATILENGNFGIGTTTPGVPLHVVRTTAGQAFRLQQTGSNIYTEMQFQTPTGNMYIFVNSSGYSSYGGANATNFYTSNGAFAFHSNAGNNHLYIANGGNIGIGNTNPAQKLDVTGNIKAKDVTGKFFSNAYSFVAADTTVSTVSLNSSGLWEYIIIVNPNTAGSGSYRDFYYGKMGVGIGYGTAVTMYIIEQPEQTAPRSLYGSGGPNFSLNWRMIYSGGVYTELPVSTTFTLRLQGLNTTSSGEVLLRRLA